MKKIVVITILILLLLPCIVFAGDTDHWIEIGDQDAFIIGKVTDFKDSLYSVHVEIVLMGDIEGVDIKVEKPDNPNCHLVVGNYIVTSLDKKGRLYKIKHGAFRVNSTDCKTLKLDYASYNNINERIQKFINSGSFIEADRKAREKKNSDNSNQTTIIQQSSLEWVYKDALKSILLPYVQEAVSNYYEENTGYSPIVDLYGNYDIISFESPSAYVFIIKFEVSPYLGAHNSIGVDQITLKVTYGEVKVEKFEHVKDYPIPPWLQHLE